jgi:molybdate transport system ATP-binding protein
MQVDGDRGLAVSFSVPLHVARRNALDKGASITVSLLKDGIHCMPPETA